jgi:phosphoglycerol transferase MdoB-like AlkP superfamily enzyme
MNDDPGQALPPLPQGRRKPLLLRLRMAQANVWIVGAPSLLIALGVADYFRRFEGSGPNLVCTSAITLALWFGLLALTRRALVSTIAIGAMIGFIVGVATAKRSLEKMAFHAYDLYFYFPNGRLLASLWGNHRAFLIAVIAGAAATLAALVVAWSIEPARVRRRYAAGLCMACIAVSAIASHEKLERRHTQLYWDDLLVSSFYGTWPEAIESLLRGQLVESASSASHRPPLLTLAQETCAPAIKPPHIILIHEESVFPPGIFPKLAYDKRLDTMFQSFDGHTRHMRVETYGGASWLTEFSVMTGLSSRSFGGIRNFLQTYMVNRLSDTLPQALSHCGYRNVLFYPMLKSFISSAPFYNSVGIKEIFDAKDQKASTPFERDRFYFANALTNLQAHVAESQAPLFTFIETMATHWPYHETFFPDEKVPGGGEGTDAEMNEFLRRLWLSKTDLEDLRAQLATRFPGERFLLVHYGDHHPVATRRLLGFAPELESEDVDLPPDSPGFITYFAVQGVNFKPRALPVMDPIDVAYLPALIIYAAGLPLPDSDTERLRLMKLCNGRYYDCPDRDEILGFHQRLIEAGLLKPR